MLGQALKKLDNGFATCAGCQVTFDENNIGKLKKNRNFCFQI